MSKHTDDMYLADMKHACHLITQFLQNYSRQDWLDDELTQNAVLHLLQRIGEGAKSIGQATKESYDIPWREVADFRNLVVHAYWEIDLDVVWDITKRYLPDLCRKLRS